MKPGTDTDTFEQFAARLGKVELEIPAPPPFGRRHSAPHHRPGLRPIASGLAAFASVGLVVVVIGASISLRGAGQTPASSTGGAMPSTAASSDLPSSALGPSPSESPATVGPTASPTKGVTRSTLPGAGQINPFDAAVQALVEDETIDSAQADALRQQIDAGSLDLQALVDSGALTAAQGQAVGDRLRAVKESLAPGPGSTEPPATSPKRSASDAVGADETAAEAAFAAAVQGLVADGTIDKAQADVLLRQIDAGSIDEQKLLDSGTLTAAQMEVVRARLGAVKQSLAAGAGGTAPSRSPSTTEPAQPYPSKTG